MGSEFMLYVKIKQDLGLDRLVSLKAKTFQQNCIAFVTRIVIAQGVAQGWPLEAIQSNGKLLAHQLCFVLTAPPPYILYSISS